MKKLTLLVAGLAFATASFACDGKGKTAKACSKDKDKKEAKVDCKDNKACCKKGEAKKA